ncbi:ATP-binding protein [Dyadobacter sp. 32]|uniref:sensor histidine kinase n=1 Tax=Dyadobacter sp. 32 TaxID=538966 RepID=UPI0011EE4E82
MAYEQRLSLKGQGPTQMTVQCDPVHLLRIIQNLVLNALKHTQEGWVLVSWDLDDDHTWSVSVQDTGPGLPATERGGTVNRVSSVTDQSDTSLVEETPDVNVQHRNMEQQTSLAHPGEGVGLSIVKGLCELLRAKFDMESKQGEGTTFRIRLPRHWPAKPVYD